MSRGDRVYRIRKIIEDRRLSITVVSFSSSARSYYGCGLGFITGRGYFFGVQTLPLMAASICSR
jgi:hypothetical protein